MPSSTSEHATNGPSPFGVTALAATLLLAGFGSYYALQRPPEAPAPAPVPPAEVPDFPPVLPSVIPDTGAKPPAPALPPVKPGDVPRAKNGKPLARTRFPDGSFQIALNDVTEELEIVWDDRRPYSPITHTEWNNGLWYWRHADGTWSTVMNIEVNGVPQAAWMTDLMSTEGTLPTADEARAQAAAGAAQSGVSGR